MMYEIEIGFEGGRNAVTTTPDEKRALELSNALMLKAGGPRAWFPIRPDADGTRLAVRFAGDGPIQTIRLRRATNGDATTPAEPKPEPPDAEPPAAPPAEPATEH